MTDPQLFDWPVTEKKEKNMPNDPDLVNRPPGWSLIANKNGSQGFHVIKSAGMLATVVTLCGITGRKISESAREIPLCQGCLDKRAEALGILDTP